MDVYLIRRNNKWAKYSNCIAVELTGAQQFGTAITGIAGTDVITVTGGLPVNGNPVFFNLIEGGAGLSTGVVYYWRDVVSNTGKLAATPAGAALNFTTDITAAKLYSANPEMTIWSPSYRNQFTTSIRNLNTSQAGASAEINVPAMIATLTSAYTTGGGGSSAVTTPTYDQLSDEVQGQPLRQDPLNVTHWRFQINTTGTPATAVAPPAYLYATWADGDVIANNEPET